MMNLRSDVFGKRALAPTLQSPSTMAGVFTLQAFSHFLVGALIAAFLMPEGALVIVLGLVTVVIMKALYRFLEAGHIVARDACNIGFLLAGGVLCLLYGLIT